MKALAKYAMRGRSQAALLGSLFAVLSMIFPPLSYISGAIMALVTMRRGIGEGALIAIIASVVLALMSQFSVGNMVVAIVFAMMVWLPVWILAAVLRQSVSLPLTIAVAAIMAMIALVVFHLAIDDTVVWWREVLNKIFAETKAQGGMANMNLMLENAPQFMTGLMTTAFFTSMLLSVLLGRWWQSALYNPGGFQQEFHAIRVDKSAAILCGLLIIWAFISAGAGSIAVDLAILAGVYASVAGVALIHHWVVNADANKGWLILMYLLLAFVAPQILVFLAILGLVDTWLNIRRFYGQSER